VTPPAATSPVLVFIALASAAIWAGGLVAIAIVAKIARDQLDPATRVLFFRALGRAYGIVGCSALAVALLSGALLLSQRSWDGTSLAAVLLAGALVLVSAAGIAQARGMTRLRRRAVAAGEDASLAGAVHRGAIRAAGLRGAIAMLSFALLALAAVLAT
jgi:hypothetical protein